MYLFFFVYSSIFGIDRFRTGVLCRAVVEASFIPEFTHGGILCMPLGQLESATALGLGRSPV